MNQELSMKELPSISPAVKPPESKEPNTEREHFDGFERELSALLDHLLDLIDQYRTLKAEQRRHQ